VKLAVVQHRIRTHERMDLAAMLALSERAAEEGVQVIVFPRVPGLSRANSLLTAFFRNVEEHAPGLTWIRPGLRYNGGELTSHATVLGRTVVLAGDDCIDPSLFAAEAALELALEASTMLAPLVVVSAVTGNARGVHACGIAAVVREGEILAEGGEGEDLVVADVPLPTPRAERSRRLPDITPVLAQRLAAHHGTKVPVTYPADLS
jgi:predicted amidohydrolase